MKPLLTLTLSLLLAGFASADMIQTKEGKVYNGKIIAEDKESYTIKYEMAPGVRNEKRILRSDVAKITKSTPDEEEWKKIQDIEVAPDRAEAKWYVDAIQGKLLAFVRRFPDSKHADEAKARAMKLNKEYKVILGGGVKFNGRLYSAGARESNAYGLDAKMAYADLERLSKTRSYKHALRKYEALQETFKHSVEASKSHRIAVTVLKNYRRSLKLMQTEQPVLAERQAKGVKTLSENQKRLFLAELAAEEKRYERAWKREKEEMKTKWLSVYEKDMKSISDALATVEATLKQFETMQAGEVIDGGRIYQMIWTKSISGEFLKAEDLMEKLAGVNFNPSYLKRLEVKLEKERRLADVLDSERRRKQSEAKEKEEESTEEGLKKEAKAG